MAAPKKKSLQAELIKALAVLHDLPPGATARDRLAHAGAVKHIWTLRFQIANNEYDAASDPFERAAARTAMREASIQMAEWEKRESSAHTDIANDLLIEAAEHEAKQAQLASALDELDE